MASHSAKKYESELKMTNVSNQQHTPSGAAFRIIGNVVRDLDMGKDTKNAQASFTIAVDNPDADHEASYFYLRCFGQLAKDAELMLTKGSRIEVFGSMQTWQNRAEKKSGVYFTVRKIIPLARCKPLPAATNEQKPADKKGADEWIASYDAAVAELERQEPKPIARRAQR